MSVADVSASLETDDTDAFNSVCESVVQESDMVVLSFDNTELSFNEGSSNVYTAS